MRKITFDRLVNVLTRLTVLSPFELGNFSPTIAAQWTAKRLSGRFTEKKRQDYAAWLCEHPEHYWQIFQLEEVLARADSCKDLYHSMKASHSSTTINKPQGSSEIQN